MLSLLRQLSWPEVRHHPWRHIAALLAVLLGVALAFSVHLINGSALSEFSSAVRAVNGEPDFELRGPPGGFDEALYERVARHPGVAVASPIVEVDTLLPGSGGSRVALHIVGIDALVAGALAPGLLPRPDAGAGRFALLDPGSIFVNEQARQRLAGPAATNPPPVGSAPAGAADLASGSSLRSLSVQTREGPVELHIAGSSGVGGAPSAVMDIAGAQSTFGLLGKLSRIDVRLAAGADRDAVLRELALPAGMRAANPDEALQRVSNVSRAYRVNLTVLALVAMFTGTFLVFSVLALSVAKREPQLALLGVLGLTGRQRLALVLLESSVLGVLGSGLGIALGTALAAIALHFFGGDLGGGYFAGVAPTLQFDALGAAGYALLGVAAAAVGGWLPARAAQAIAPAQALKGLGRTAASAGTPPRMAIGLLAAAGPLALLPPIGGIPVAAYLSIACLLLGGIAAVPVAVGWLLRGVATPTRPLAMLAIERARHRRDHATIAVAGVVASLALSVAMTVMVASFRDSVARWLDTVLPADLYVRSSGSAPAVGLPPGTPGRTAQLAGVQRVVPQRVAQVSLDPTRPAVALIARPLDDPEHSLPLLGDLLPLPSGELAAYVSEAMVDLYHARPGSRLALVLPNGAAATVYVRGVWRDYARQFGAVLMGSADYVRVTSDERVDDLALWLAPGASIAAVERELRGALEPLLPSGARLELAATREIRSASLRIFDRSFAVTVWLQAVAVAIGLFGVAASFSAQVLARRKEFGLLTHLGLTRRQILGVVAAEAAVWTGCGALLGLLLGLVVSVVLVKVVNPQSFHWTMELALPWARVGALCAAVVAAGTLTAWLAARQSALGQMALAVKEDW